VLNEVPNACRRGGGLREVRAAEVTMTRRSEGTEGGVRGRRECDDIGDVFDFGGSIQRSSSSWTSAVSWGEDP